MMKKILQFFILCSLGITSIYAATSSRKTFLMPRAHGVNLPMELNLYHDLIFDYPNKHESNIQFTPFFQATTQGSDLGKYFGIGNGRNSFAFNTDVNSNLIVHQRNVALANTHQGTLILTPKQRSGGLRIDFLQYLKFPIKNSFFKLSAPIVYIENDLNFSIVNVANDPNRQMESFFKGDPLTQTPANLQNALTSARLTPGKQCTFGVADIDIAYGYKLVEDSHKHLFLNLGVTIPTGTRVRGDDLFEPVYGNGHHFAFGFGVDASAKLWNKKRHSGKMVFALNYRYLFEGTEKRTIPLKSETNRWAHYYLTGKQNDATNTPLTPGANILTQDVSVRPGNQIDAMLLFSFKSQKFLIDLGYNFFNKETESVSLKHSWQDDTYAIAQANYDVNANGSHPFNVNDIAHALLKINNNILDIPGAATSSQLTNKVFAGLGYEFHIMKKYPSLFGIGGSYEFANSNSVFENYALWAKLGISF